MSVQGHFITYVTLWPAFGGFSNAQDTF